MKTKFALTLAALCAAPVTFAQDSSLQALDDAAKIMNNCAAIAKQIAAIPAPPGQDMVATARSYHELHSATAEKAGGAENSEAAKAARKKWREDFEKSLTPEQLAFRKDVSAGREALRDCGREYAKVDASSHALAKTVAGALAAQKTPSDEGKKTGAALMAYMSASQNLVKEIAALSKDIETQRYVARVISRYFLGTEDDHGQPVAKKQ